MGIMDPLDKYWAFPPRINILWETNMSWLLHAAIIDQYFWWLPEISMVDSVLDDINHEM